MPLHMHAQAMNKYHWGEMLTEVVVDQKFVDGNCGPFYRSESVHAPLSVELLTLVCMNLVQGQY